MVRWLRFDVIVRGPPLPFVLVATVVLADVATSIVFHGGALDALRDLEARSGGWLRPTLVFGIASAALVVGVLLVGFGGMRAPHLALDAREVRRWVATLVVGWCSIQLAIVIAALLAGTTCVELVAPTTMVLADLVAQVFVTAIVEEIVYRGVLLAQLVRRFRGGTSETAALVAGVTCSSAVFAASHIPGLTSGGVDAVELASALLQLFAAGVFFALVYLRSGSLLTVAALHALENAPTPFLALTDGSRATLQIAVTIAGALYVLRRRWPR
jgi:membrane protease YdiL (CAAX protease family)